jgi:cellulose biosynthesis protein BcsQ
VRVFATYNIKGGVGKTATAVNLAYLAAAEGSRTLVWDLDPQGAASFYFRVKPKIKGGGRKLIRRRGRIPRAIKSTDFDGLDLLPADFSYRHLDLTLDRTKKPAKRLGRVIEPLAEEYDFLFLDCPPSISLVSESVFEAADYLLVPTIPTTLSLRTLGQLTKHLRKQSIRVGVLPFFCMVDRRKSLHSASLAEGSAHGTLRASIPYSSIVERMGLHRAPLATFAAGSAAASAYDALWLEIQERVEAPDVVEVKR